MTVILIVEDHKTVGEMIARFVTRFVPASATKVVNSAEAALEHLATLNTDGDAGAWPDLLLVDVSLPDMSGIDLVKRLQQEYPHLPCLMLSGHREPGYVRRSLDLGARGYVAKGNPLAIVEGVRKVLDGGVYVSEELREA